MNEELRTSVFISGNAFIVLLYFSFTVLNILETNLYKKHTLLKILKKASHHLLDKAQKTDIKVSESSSVKILLLLFHFNPLSLS